MHEISKLARASLSHAEETTDRHWTDGLTTRALSLKPDLEAIERARVTTVWASLMPLGITSVLLFMLSMRAREATG